MDCVLVPSVTLYGTTQVSSVRTITHTTTTTYLGEPAIALETITSTVCEGAVCRPEVATSLVTITPTVTTTVYSTETRSGLVTNVVPQQTLYYPCSAGVTSMSTSEEAVSMGEQEVVHVFSSASEAVESTAPSSSGVPSSSRSSEASTRGSSSTPTPTSTRTLPTSTPTSRIVTFTPPGSTPSPSATTLSSSASSTSRGPIIAGALVGTLVALVLFCILVAYCRRERSRTGSTAESIGTADYWERRFRELEADDSPLDDSSEGKKLRLTLDLRSKGMSTRPASRLSAISAFFSKPADAPPAAPEPFVAGHGRSGLNFSRPRFGKQHSVVSGKSGRSARASVKSMSHWLGFGAAPEVPGRSITPAASQKSPEDRDERKAMEWMRSSGAFAEGRAEGAEGSAEAVSTADTQLKRCSLPDSPPPTPSLLPTHRLPIPPLGRQLTPPKRSSEAPQPGSSPLSLPTLGTTKSFAAHRPATRKHAPELLLSRAAITPSLWVDDEVYDEFTSRRSDPDGLRPEQSRFSPDSSVPPLSALPSTDGAYGGIAQEPQTSSLPSAAMSLASSASTGDVDEAAAGEYERSLERSAVTPQLPLVQLGSGLAEGMGLEFDLGSEERIRTVYVSDE